MDDLLEGHVYQATLPSSRKSPREYVLVRIAGNTLTLRYGWFGFEGATTGTKGKRATPDDRWTWSPRGVERHSRFELDAIKDLGAAPAEGQLRKKFRWAMETLG